MYAVSFGLFEIENGYTAVIDTLVSGVNAKNTGNLP
jgi:hypothetical protein